MKTKCPHCGGAVCNECVDGKIEMTIATGNQYTSECLNEKCGFKDGFKFTTGPCVQCGGATRWKLVECDGCDEQAHKKSPRVAG